MALLHLRIKEVEVKKDAEDITPKSKFMTYKDKRKNLSRMQRKVFIYFFGYSEQKCETEFGTDNSPVYRAKFHWVPREQWLIEKTGPYTCTIIL